MKEVGTLHSRLFLDNFPSLVSKTVSHNVLFPGLGSNSVFSENGPLKSSK